MLLQIALNFSFLVVGLGVGAGLGLMYANHAMYSKGYQRGFYQGKFSKDTEPDLDLEAPFRGLRRSENKARRQRYNR